jgi:hypothetical protein
MWRFVTPWLSIVLILIPTSTRSIALASNQYTAPMGIRVPHGGARAMTMERSGGEDGTLTSTQMYSETVEPSSFASFESEIAVSFSSGFGEVDV